MPLIEGGMSNDFVLVDPKAWEYDLHSVRRSEPCWNRHIGPDRSGQIYSAYIGYFQVYNIPW